MKKVILLSFIIAYFVIPGIVVAAPAGVSVVPSVLRMDLAHEEPTADIIYTNNTDETISVTLTAANFTALEDGYKLSFLEKKNEDTYSYGLASWITFTSPTLVLKPHQTQTATVRINAQELPPGGHYGAVLAQLQRESGTGPISILGTISSLLFVRNPHGIIREEARLETFSSNQQWASMPTEYKLRFHNTGNIDIAPYGIVTVHDMFGRTVLKGILNEGSLYTLPETIRRYDIPLRKLTWLVPGMYTAELHLHYGTKPLRVERSEVFFSLGDVPWWVLGVVLGAIFFGIYHYRRHQSSK